MGFNTIRLPFSLQALDSDVRSPVPTSPVGKNAALQGKTPQQAMDVVIDAAARAGLMVLLENHSLADDGYSYGLWYGQAGYDENDWVASVAGARAALRGQDERHRRRSEERAARRRDVGHRRPDGLAARGHAGGQRGHRDRAELAHRRRGHREAASPAAGSTRTGGAATSRACAGTRCASSAANRLVYSPHEYGPGVFPQPWFGRPDTAKLLERALARRLGLHRRAGHRAAARSASSAAARSTSAATRAAGSVSSSTTSRAPGISWTYWALNPDSGDTGGVLSDDWTTPDGRQARPAAAHDPPSAHRLRRRTGGTAPTVQRTTSAKPRPEGQNGLKRPSSSRIAVGDGLVRAPRGHRQRTARTSPGATVGFTLPAGTRITQTWNGEFSGDGGSRARGPARVGARAA